MNGTHISCIVPAHLQASFHNRKEFTSQNMLTIVDFELKFTYLVAGWRGQFTMLGFYIMPKVTRLLDSRIYSWISLTAVCFMM